MKGKVLSLKIVLCAMALLIAGFCFGVGVLPKNQQQVSAASTKVSLTTNGVKEEYSAVFAGDIIFSVEKVLTSDDYDSSSPNVNIMLGTDSVTGLDKDYHFKNIQNGTQTKTVVDNGQFVVMRNELKNNQMVAPGADGEQESLMVSFGAYVYTPETATTAENVKIANNDEYSHITYLEVAMERNGEKQPLPNVRDIYEDNVGLFFDFVCVIDQKQDNSNEGFYKFTVKYMIDNVEHVESFEFYVVNELSYIQDIETEFPNFGYKAEPTLGWTEDEEFSKVSATYEKDGYVRYYIGTSGVGNQNLSYPTITYDYTKYKLSFTHTANQKNTVYDFACQFNRSLDKQTAQLNYTITSKDETIADFINLEDYKQDSTINLVTIMLTEPGTYTFDYDLIYDGYNAGAAPNVGIEPQQIKLAIHGLSAQYSKTDYEGAQLQYFELATKKGNHVDLFVPHGYDVDKNIDSLMGKELGFVYKLIESNLREGNVVCENSKNSLINDYLTNKMIDGKNQYEYLKDNISNIRDINSMGNIKDNLDLIFKDTIYVDTNQGSIWIEGNDQFTDNSFYFYNPTKISTDVFVSNIDNNKTVADGDDKYGLKFSNTTSFNKKGYYLVFLETIPNGITASNSNFWQVFAFQYTSSSVDIKIETEYGDIIAGGKYTNENVTVSWKKPGVFDRKIKGYYYSITNKNATREELLLTSKHSLNAVENAGEFVSSLGEDVKDGSFVKYLIRLESEGESATHKIFTIDRQDISGVQAYLIQEMYSGHSVFYSYATDYYNNVIPINNSITDSYATIRWDDKASGAGITATYNFTPFVQNPDDSEVMTGTSGRTWITTNYGLGTTIKGSSLTKSSLDNYNISSDSILFNQGIYIINIKDDAGNECYYAFVIDRTENYFKIDEQIVTNSLVIFGDNVDYSIGDYKAFELDIPTDLTNSGNAYLKEFIEKASTNNLSEFNNGLYYDGIYNNANIISNYFQKSGGKYYFTVKNNNVIGVNTQEKVDTSINGTKGSLIYNAAGQSYYKITLYAVAENQTYSIYDAKDGAYVSVEINKDNARGLVYYSSNYIENVPLDGQENESIKKLVTGSDTKDNGVETSGMVGARATSASNIAFVWNMGSGKFEVSEVYYTFYSLKPLDFNETENGKYYFYHTTETEPNYIYKEGSFEPGGSALGDGRAIFNFNGREDSLDGLYVVTRIYKAGEDDTDEDDNGLGDDVAEKKYYFIVDRNEIIDAVQGIGGSIKIDLLEKEVPFNEFTTGGADYETFSVANEVYNQRYNIYLKTTKVPAVINVPIGKYLTKNQISDYYAGRLNVQVYFNDFYGQLVGARKNRAVKIYDSKDVEENSFVISDIFSINIYSYLSNPKYGNIELRDRITESSTNGTWLFLSGDYIIKITDNVVNELGQNHVKYIGFRVEGVKDAGPQIEVFTGFDKTEDGFVKIIPNSDEEFNYSATVSQEYLRVVLPKYDENVTERAQVDPNYLVVKQFDGYNSLPVDYINYPYEHKNGYNLKDYTLGIVSQLDDGSVAILLDTKLRKDGKIDLNNLNKPLKYTITVRYKIGDDQDPDKFENCYVYYNANGERVNYYYATYTIIIDREAPTKNIEALNLSDAFVEEYNQYFGTAKMIDNGVHETSSYIYFTKQYVKYYEEEKKDKGYIYVYQVGENTKFYADDIEYVFVKTIGNTSADLASYNLTLPMIDESDYTRKIEVGTFVDPTTGEGDYSGILTTPGYYEIVERDYAGNITQYVVHYEPGEVSIDLPISFQTTSAEEVELEINWDEDDIENNAYYVYGLEASGTAVFEGLTFLKIEVQRLGGDNIIDPILTSATTDFGKINQKVVDAIKLEQYGDFSLTITKRTISEDINYQTSTTNIHLYDVSEYITLAIENLVLVQSGVYYIDLHGANVPDPEKNLLYFATEITVKSSQTGITLTYYGKMNKEGVVEYTDQDGEKITRPIKCDPDTTYSLTMKDVLNPIRPQYHRFNTSGNDPYDIKFENAFAENDFGDNYYFNNSTYHGYTTAKILYDKTFSAELEFKRNGDYTKQNPENTTNGIYEFVSGISDSNYNEIYLYVTPENGEIFIDAKITIYETITQNGESIDSEVHTYYVIIDTRLQPVTLRDYNTTELKDIITDHHNKDYLDSSISGGNSTGHLVLNWDKVEENSYFEYEYRLYELLLDKTYRLGPDGKPGLDLSKVTSHNIITNSDSTGIYKFVISVYSKDKTICLGNRISAFEVRAKSDKLYEVRFVNDITKVMDEPNSSFRVDEEDISVALVTKIKDEFPIISNRVNFPLYIANEELELILLSDHAGIEKSDPVAIDVQLPSYAFYMYKISKNEEFDLYIGILQVSKVPNIVSNIQIINGGIPQNITDITDLTITGDVDDEIIIKANKKAVLEEKGILNKNTLRIEVRYGGTETEMDSFDFSSGQYVINGNGQYSFIIKDLAGNIHTYDNKSEKLKVYVLREVVVLVNDEAPIDNAFYNDAVTMTIYSSNRYVTGSISVFAEKNGEPYEYSGFNPYVFSDFGTYRITVTAKYADMEYPLTKVITFTIVNVKEARKSIDLTSLTGCEIRNVTNPYGNDVKKAFITMLNTSGCGMNISYDNVMGYENNPAYQDKFNITAGKVTFTITYVVKDDKYPDRIVDFSFTLNNEDPVIDCSLEKGGKTTKDFKIYFNPAILYSQIGEAYIYINDEIVAHIDENSANTEVSIKTSFKANGDGAYYVKLVGTSGVVWDSFKVTIKEPLNFWAIVVIVVVVAVVATVVVTVIVLRRRMRIR